MNNNGSAEKRQGQIAEELERLERNIATAKECLNTLTSKLNACLRKED